MPPLKRSEPSREAPKSRSIASFFKVERTAPPSAEAAHVQIRSSREASDVKKLAGASSANEKSDYELLREANIARNKGVMNELGLADATMKKSTKKSVSRKKKRVEDATPVETRRSKRSRGEKPDYTAEKINNFGEELDRLAARPGGLKGLILEDALKSKAQREAEDLSLLPSLEEEVKQALEAQREALSTAVPSSSSTDAMEQQCRDEAVKRWGEAVLMANPPSWQKYLLSRTSVEVPRSPMLLLQERYAPYGAWHLLIACNLMTRVSSAETKHRCIEGFFAEFPTPTRCLEHATAESVQPIIASLGLFPGRYKGIVDITRRFLMDPEFNCERKGEHKIFGIGEFGVSSFEIWVRGLGKAMIPEDATLRSFCSWLRKSAKVEADDKNQTDSKGQAVEQNECQEIAIKKEEDL